jgi:hypothetical protein
MTDESHDYTYISKTGQLAFENGRKTMREDILKIINGCVDRDETLKKLAEAIKELD